MKLEEIQRIMKQYDDLDTYVRSVFAEFADARGIRYSYFESFTINAGLGQVEVNYSVRNCGCCEDDHDSVYFDVELLTEELDVVTARLKVEAAEREIREVKAKEVRRLAVENQKRESELNQLRLLQAKYKT